VSTHGVLNDRIYTVNRRIDLLHSVTLHVQPFLSQYLGLVVPMGNVDGDG
jgi:hypothetical protein